MLRQVFLSNTKIYMCVFDLFFLNKRTRKTSDFFLNAKNIYLLLFLLFYFIILEREYA
jgi:hypothetical protein